MKFDQAIIKELDKQKNLLAFSYGVDSTALFFLLIDFDIDFDIAIVNYNMRVESKDELKSAKELALKYNKKIFFKECNIENKSNFEKQARDIRYDFFYEIIQQHNYDNLLTAHQLNDRLEWLLMQLTKGAGLSELYGMNSIDTLKTYQIIRPLLDISKNKLIEYLEINKKRYFIDSSNSTNQYKRNYFRHNFSDQLISQYENGITRSFNYLKKDINSLQKSNIIYNKDNYYIIEDIKDDNINIRTIDKIVKKLGVLLSSASKKDIIKTKDCVVSHKIAIVYRNNKIYIAPYVKRKMYKSFKEKMRIEMIPPKIRGYLACIENKKKV